MKLIFATEARFVKDAEGNFYGFAAFDQELWDRYLNVFSEIRIVARVLTVDKYSGDFECITLNDHVKFVELPYVIGLKEYFLKRKQIKKVIKKLVSDNKEERFICRIPGSIGSMVISELNNIQKPYAVEVVGDPWEVFAPGGVRHLFRPLIRIGSTLNLKQNVKNASTVLYVTKNTLQKRYPSRNAKFTTFASNVKLEETNVVKVPKSLKKKDTYQIISIGSLSQMYKSPDIVLKTIKQLNDEGITCYLTWLGGGVFLKSMQSLANELGIAHLVNFKGDVSKEEVRADLLHSDLFVLASKTEGLPRVIIEAMSAGLPCIGTRVGGIPELLDEEVLVAKNNENELAAKMNKLLTDREFYNWQAKRNLKESENYTETILSERRNQYYNYILNYL